MMRIAAMIESAKETSLTRWATFAAVAFRLGLLASLHFVNMMASSNLYFVLGDTRQKLK